MGRYERSAEEFCVEYAANNEYFESQPVKTMSKLTKNLLRGIDYIMVKEKRTENFRYLHQAFEKINKLNLHIPDGAFMYPLYLENGFEIRKELQKKKIYIPLLWPNVLEVCSKDSVEYQSAANILPLPLDQRYGIEDMKYMEEMIKSCIS